MREIILYRHAQAEPSEGGRPDEERRLTAAGREAAADLGRLLKEHKRVPQRVLCSPATRAVQTAELCAASAQAPVALERLPELYTGGLDHYIAAFADQPPELDRVMIVGHNPIIEEVIEHLAGTHQRISSGRAAVLQFDVPEWDTIAAELKARLAGIFPEAPPASGG